MTCRNPPSSGGLLLKYPGRIGEVSCPPSLISFRIYNSEWIRIQEAAVFGAGVWANSPPGISTGVACSVSGEFACEE